LRKRGRARCGENDAKLAQKLGQLQTVIGWCSPTGIHGPTCICWANRAPSFRAMPPHGVNPAAGWRLARRTMSASMTFRSAASGARTVWGQSPSCLALAVARKVSGWPRRCKLDYDCIPVGIRL
jgi:hypothetical protein